MIKQSMAKEAAIDFEREVRRIKAHENEVAKRLAEIENKRLEDIRKKDIEYRQKREAVMKFGVQKSAIEAEACKEYLRVIENRMNISEENHKMELL